MSRCDLEKKKLYDLMQFLAYHSRERLVEIFNECYDDNRDIKRVLDMITTMSGVVKLVGSTLMIILNQIENKSIEMLLGNYATSSMIEILYWSEDSISSYLFIWLIFRDT